jgi:hypothetical protein
MKLTKYHKECFVSAVMCDVPQVDYAEQYQKLIEKDMLDQASPLLKQALGDPEIRSMLLSGHVSASPDTIKANNSYHSSHSLDVGSVAVYCGFEPSATAKKQAEKIMNAALVAKTARKALEDKVSAAIFACSTLKVAQERMPEFAKYLPEEPSKTGFLPSIANLAADLVTAGWKAPKAATAS